MSGNADSGTDRRDGAFLPGFPAFVNELAGTLAVHAQYVLHGNIRDQFLMPAGDDRKRPTQLLPLLWQALQWPSPSTR